VVVGGGFFTCLSYRVSFRRVIVESVLPPEFKAGDRVKSRIRSRYLESTRYKITNYRNINRFRRSPIRAGLCLWLFRRPRIRIDRIPMTVLTQHCLVPRHSSHLNPQIPRKQNPSSFLLISSTASTEPSLCSNITQVDAKIPDSVKTDSTMIPSRSTARDKATTTRSHQGH
jgi:hypothetical protein